MLGLKAANRLYLVSFEHFIDKNGFRCKLAVVCRALFEHYEYLFLSWACIGIAIHPTSGVGQLKDR